MTFFHIDRDICLLYDIFPEAQPEDDDSDDAYCDFIKKTYKDEEKALECCGPITG